MQPEIVSLGEPMLEFNAKTTGHLKDVSTFKRGWGGDTSNFAVAVARLGRSVGYMCRVGNDEFGKCFLELWRMEGVDTSRVIVEENGFTGIYFISIREEGEHDFTYYRANSPASHFSIDDLDPKYIEGAKLFHTSGISQAISESSRETVFKAMEIAKRSEVLVTYDPNLRLKLWPINTARATILHTFELADVVFPSIEDVRTLLGPVSPEAAASQILKRGPKIVVIKLGAKGCLVMTQDQMVRIPGFQVTPVDTTGAGDAFDGAFAVGLLEEWTIEETAEFANAVGALTTLRKGAVAPLPRREQVDDFITSQSQKGAM
jgi:2-dehydro-3-deoxygluconokinase